MRFVIDVDRWLRGEGEIKSRLLRASDRKMCCMGQVCIQLGFSEAEIAGHKTLMAVVGPAQLDDRMEKFTKSCVAGWIGEAYEENDGAANRDKLRACFARGGHELVFSDE